jgi:hypothetical protein
MLAGILASYALIIGAGGTVFGYAGRVLLLGVLLWTALRTRNVRQQRGWVAILVTGVVFAVTLITALVGSPRLTEGVVGAGTFAMISLLIGVIISTVLRIGRVDTEAVLGTLCVYLLLALFFSSLNQVFASAMHGYLHGTADPPTDSDLLYYSVITVTTVGYGDITPAQELARAVAVVEALVGQLYLVSVVAGVIGGWQRRPREQ